MPSFKPLLIVAVAAVAAFILSGARAHAQGTTLHGTAGPAFNISLVDASGNPVTHLDPGTYTIVVDDMSEEHNFHLKGPGVDQFTPVALVGDVHVDGHVHRRELHVPLRCAPHADDAHVRRRERAASDNDHNHNP